MGKIFAQPSPAPIATAPTRVDLFAVMPAMDTMAEKPRRAHQCEVFAYLIDLAKARGIEVPSTATLSEAGIYDEGRGYILDMPGYGADAAVIMEETDEAGNVVRSSRIGTNAKGHIGLKADAVRKACALPKVRKPRAVKAVAVASAPAEPVQRVEPAPAPDMPADASAALLARLEALESIVARLSRPAAAGKRVRSEAERAAIVRAWRYRCEARARADLDRRALLAAGEANQMLLGKLADAERARDTAVEQVSNARRAAADYRQDAEALSVAWSAAHNRAYRMRKAALRHRTAASRAAADLRAAHAESRALMRRLSAQPAPRVPSTPSPLPVALLA